MVYLGPDLELDENSAKVPYETPNNFVASPPIDTQSAERQTPTVPRDSENLANLEKQLSQLADLIANITESYTTAIFLVEDNSTLQNIAVRTLSRDFVEKSRIPFGSGLVGWTAQHGLRISVCPFEHDAMTLLYYSSEQDLKSFVAVPILSDTGRLLGVIACDSKKTYAFSKIAEKILVDCASQAANLILLHEAIDRANIKWAPKEDELSGELEKLRQFVDEDLLLSAVADLPSTIISRDALVVITSPVAGICHGRYYTGHSESKANHRLLDTLCKHKKVICADRSVQARTVDDTQKRSFLSVPFRVLGREAGSFNLLSKPDGAFHAAEIEALERIADVVSKQLELIRLRAVHASTKETTSLSSWKVFSSHASALLQEARKQRRSLSLFRISLTNLSELEELFGVEAATVAMHGLMRLVDQVKPQNALACYLYGTHILLLLDSTEAATISARLSRLIERISLNGMVASPQPGSSAFGARVAERVLLKSAKYPRDGESLAALIAGTLPNSGSRVLNNQHNKDEEQFVFEEVAHAGSWK